MNFNTGKILLIAFLLFSACSGKKNPQTLEEKQEQLKALKAEAAEMQTKIKTLEQEITAVSGEPQKKDLRMVEATSLAAGTFQHFVEVQGNVDSRKNVLVQPEMQGRVTAVLVEEGQQVRQGQKLLQLDSEVLRRNMQELETRLKLATTIFERQENLWKQNIGSEVQYLQAKNEKEAVESSIASLEAQLRKTGITSPISGTVDEIFVNQGEMATPGAPMVRVVNLSNVVVDAEVSEVYVKDVQRGDTVQVNFPSLDMQVALPVKAVGQFINPDNRTFNIEVQVPNPKGYLKPNTLATVKINDFTRNNAVSVPSFVLQKNTQGQTFLYRIKQQDGKNVAEKVFVTPSRSYNGYTLIEEGLSAGDNIITKGYNDVIDGEEVRVRTQNT